MSDLFWIGIGVGAVGLSLALYGVITLLLKRETFDDLVDLGDE